MIHCFGWAIGGRGSLDAQNEEATNELREEGLTPVPVPHDDPRYRGTVYDDKAAKQVEIVPFFIAPFGGVAALVNLR
jgi:hypothetical protein